MTTEKTWLKGKDCAKALRCSETTVNRFRYNGIFKQEKHFMRLGSGSRAAVVYDIDSIKQTLESLADAYCKGDRLSYWELMAGKFYHFTFKRHDIEPEASIQQIPGTLEASTKAAHKLATDLMEACKAYLQIEAAK